MGLPKIDIPLHTGKILSTEEEIKFRPFTVKEEKILLTAQESQDIGAIFNAIEQVLSNCIVGRTVNELTLFDVTYLLLQVRSASVSEQIEFKIRDPDTDEEVELSFDIGKVSLDKDEDHTNIININDEMTLAMRYPSFKEMSILKNGDSDELFEILVSCMDKLIHGDVVYNFADFNNEEISEFVESLSKPNFESMKKFFQTIPVIRTEFEYVNKNGDEKKFVISGIEGFFT